MDRAKSTMAQQIAQAAITFEQRRTGNHVPKSLTVVLSEGTLVITLHDALSPAEMNLAKTPEGAAQIQEFHRQLFDNSSDSLRQEISRITGMDVREATAVIEPKSGAVVHAFSSGNVVQVYQLAGSAPTEAWSGNAPGNLDVKLERGATRTGSLGLSGSSTATESNTTMHATSELREWFLEWLDGDNGQFDNEAVGKLKELRSCTDELPADYCQHGRLHMPFGVSYGVAAQKMLGNKD